MLQTKALLVVLLSVFVFLNAFSISNVYASQTLTLSPIEFGSLTPKGVTLDKSQIYFISGVKSMAYFTFGPSNVLSNAKIELIVLRVKTHIVFDSNYVSAYRWVGSWTNQTWDKYTEEKEIAGERNCISAKWMDQMDTWYSYTFSSSDTIGTALALLPVTVHLESSFLGTNFPETLIDIEEAQLVVTYTTEEPSPSNASPDSSSTEPEDTSQTDQSTEQSQNQPGVFLPTEFIVVIAVVFLLLIGIIGVLLSRSRRSKSAKQSLK
jgi:hypothetical protein